MKRALALSVGWVLLTWGCASQELEQEESSDSFSSNFEVLETRPGSKKASAPESSLVDYESGITVRPDRAALSRLIKPGGTDVDTTLTRDERQAIDQRIAEAQRDLAILDDLRGIVERVIEYERESIEYYDNLAEGAIPQEDLTFQRLAQRRGEIIDALDTVARIHYETVVLGQPWDWNPDPDMDENSEEAVVHDQHVQERSKIYDLMAPPSERSDRNRYDAEQVTRILNVTMEALRGRIEDLERAILAKAPKAEVEMEAAIVRGEESLPVSISPYTIVEGVERGKKSRRVGMPGEKDLAAVRTSYDAYDELADAVNGLKETIKDEEAVRQLTEEFLDELKNAAERLKDGLIEDLRQAADLEGPEFAPLREPATALASELHDLRLEIESLAKAGDPVDLATRAATLVDSLRSERLQTIANLISALKTALAGLPETLEGQAREIIERLRTSVEAEADHLLAALEGAPGGADVAQLVRSLKALAERANAQSFGDLKAGKITRKPFSIDAAQDGFVDLANSPAESGDRVSVTYKVTVNPGAEEAERTEYYGSAWLDVRKFGLYTTLKSQLLFYDRLSDGSSSYRAAPGLAYTFHYRPESAQTFHDTVAPGLGISVSSPSFEDGAELAVGPQLTLFNDMLQVGYAYDISVSDDNWMFFFGLDLIGAFQKVQ